jgi:hypothetical protein
MKIVDIKEVENGYWKLTADFADTNIFEESSKNIILYYRNKEPPLSELAFAYTINYINNNGALEE